jgi:egghead protein (zeste-white 4 protein)
MAEGARCRWVDGYLLEQSTQSIRDFVKQRRRWFAGMVRVVLYTDVQPWIRVPLAAFTAIWSVSWLSILYTYMNIGLGMRTAPPVAALGDFSLAMFTMTYLVGLYVNLRDLPRLPAHRRAVLYGLQVALMPVFAVLEATGVVAGMLRPERGFHVVDKSGASAPMSP